MRTGDHVRHRASGEIWEIAYHRKGYICAAGWPDGEVPEGDVELVKEATDAEHEKAVEAWMNAPSGDSQRRVWCVKDTYPETVAKIQARFARSASSCDGETR